MKNLYEELSNKFKETLKETMGCQVALLTKIKEIVVTKIQKVDSNLTKAECEDLCTYPDVYQLLDTSY